MAVVFGGAPGRVIRMDDPAIAQGVLPALVDVKPDQITFQKRKSIITRVAMSQETNNQFTHALGGDIYVYVFGDRIAPLTISGMCFAIDCDKEGDVEHGMELMLKWYNNNKLSKRKKPVTVMVGQTPLTAFVTGFNAAVFDHKLRIVQFDLMMALVPERT